MRRLLPFSLLLCVSVSAALAAEPIRIDDTTLLDPDGTVRFVSRDVAAAPQELPALRPATRSFTDVYTGCSSNDVGAPFDRDTLVPGPAIGLLPEGDYPYDATMHPEGHEVWIVGSAGDGVVVVDVFTNTVTHRITVGDYPVSVQFSQDQALALVACRGSRELKIISTNTYTVVDSLTVPTNFLGAGNLALDPIGGNFYLVDWYDQDLFEIAPDGSAVLRQTRIGDSLWQLVVSPDGERIYVTDRATDEVRVVNRTTMAQVDSWPVGDDPWGIDVTLDGEKIVVACEDSHEAFIVDTATGTTKVLPLGPTADPRDVDIRDDQGIAYVAGGSITGGNPVYRVDLVSDTVAGNVLVNGSNVNVVAAQRQPVLIFTDDVPPFAASAAGLRALPSPFGAATSVRYALHRTAPVSLTVCDVAGRTVRRLERGRRSEGEHETPWDGRDDAGAEVANGVYFLRLDVEGDVTTRKIVRMAR